MEAPFSVGSFGATFGFDFGGFALHISALFRHIREVGKPGVKQLSLHFDKNRSSRLSLYKTEVIRTDSKRIVAQVGTKYHRGFKWTPAVQALCLLLAKYAVHCSTQRKAEPFSFTTAEDSEHARSLDDRMDKEKEGEASWIVQIFGERDQDGHTPLYYLLQNRINPGGVSPGPVGFRIYPTSFPIANLQIYLAGRLETRPEALISLAAEIKAQWRPKERRGKENRQANTVISKPEAQSVLPSDAPPAPGPQPPTVRAGLATAASATPLLTSVETGKKKPVKKRGTKGAKAATSKAETLCSTVHPRHNSPVADWYRQVTLQRITTHLLSIAATRKKDLPHDFTPYDCIAVIADKVAHANEAEFVNFYCAESTPWFESVKRDVSSVIASDMFLSAAISRRMHSAKNFLGQLAMWFAVADRYFPFDFLTPLNSEFYDRHGLQHLWLR